MAKSIYSIPEHQYRPIDASRTAASAQAEYHQVRDLTPLVIDNGSSHMRAGFASSSRPSVVAEAVTAKYKDKKTNKTIVLAGSEAYVDSISKSALKTAFEGDIVSSFEPMETMLDYVFTKLGIDSERIDHPIVMTEALCNPHYTRGLMSELLFEGYSAPSLTYGVDSLFAFHSSPSPADGLVISSSTSSTTVIPVLDGRGILTSAKKLPWGASQSAEYMLKLMQLKYPTFPGRLFTFQASTIYKEHCYYSDDYITELKSFSNSSHLASIDRVVQFPFVPLVWEEKSEEDKLRATEKKRETGKRLQEIAVKQRLEKLVRQEEEKIVFAELKASKGVGRKVDYDKRLKDAGFSSSEDLDIYLRKIEGSLQRARNKELGVDENEGKEPPTFPLVDVPDHTLNEEDLKEKRRQRLMKAGYDARIRAKMERDADKELQELERKRDDEERKTDPAGWLRGLRRQHEAAILSIKERQKRKEQLSDRKSLAAQQRMKSIATLASEANVGKKRRRGEDEDEFGRNDEDWAVYREIGNADDSDEEEDEQTALKTVEARLLEYDSEFTIDHTAERLALRKHQILNAFVRGLSPEDPVDTYDPLSLEHNSQLHVNVERIRVPEVLYQPHTAGVDQAGLGEIIEHVLKAFTSEERDRLTKNIYVTGGNTLIPQFDERLRNSIRPHLPPSSPLNIVREANDADLAAWKGMARWSATEECQTALVTKAEYDEYGGGWLRSHRFSGR